MPKFTSPAGAGSKRRLVATGAKPAASQRGHDHDRNECKDRRNDQSELQLPRVISKLNCVLSSWQWHRAERMIGHIEVNTFSIDISFPSRVVGVAYDEH